MDRNWDSTAPRGVCSVCGRDGALTKVGVMRAHGGAERITGDGGRRRDHCRGSGQPPKEAGR